MLPICRTKTKALTGPFTVHFNYYDGLPPEASSSHNFLWFYNTWQQHPSGKGQGVVEEESHRSTMQTQLQQVCWAITGATFPIIEHSQEQQAMVDERGKSITRKWTFCITLCITNSSTDLGLLAGKKLLFLTRERTLILIWITVYFWLISRKVLGLYFISLYISYWLYFM